MKRGAPPSAYGVYGPSAVNGQHVFSLLHQIEVELATLADISSKVGGLHVKSSTSASADAQTAVWDPRQLTPVCDS